MFEARMEFAMGEERRSGLQPLRSGEGDGKLH